MGDYKINNDVVTKSKMSLSHISKKINPKSAAIILLVAVLLSMAFLTGSRYGANRQKQSASPSASPDIAKILNGSIGRWTSVGILTKVSESKFEVKDSRGNTREAAITKDTKITNRQGETVAAKDLKVDSRVIVSGIIDVKDNTKLTATRIRLQR